MRKFHDAALHIEEKVSVGNADLTVLINLGWNKYRCTIKLLERSRSCKEPDSTLRVYYTLKILEDEDDSDVAAVKVAVLVVLKEHGLFNLEPGIIIKHGDQQMLKNKPPPHAYKKATYLSRFTNTAHPSYCPCSDRLL